MTRCLIFALETRRAPQAGSPGYVRVPAIGAIHRCIHSSCSVLSSRRGQAVGHSIKRVIARATRVLRVVLLLRAGYTSRAIDASATMLVGDLALSTLSRDAIFA